MFRKIKVESKDHLEKIKEAYRSKFYIPVFKDADRYPAIMITYIDSDPTRLDYIGEVYNCFIYKEEIKALEK